MLVSLEISFLEQIPNLRILSLLQVLCKYYKNSLQHKGQEKQCNSVHFHHYTVNEKSQNVPVFTATDSPAIILSTSSFSPSKFKSEKSYY